MSAKESDPLGTNIKRLRERLGMSQRSLARAAQVNPSTVRDWESGKCMPRRNRLEFIAAALGVHLSALLPPGWGGGDDPDAKEARELLDALSPDDRKLAVAALRRLRGDA